MIGTFRSTFMWPLSTNQLQLPLPPCCSQKSAILSPYYYDVQQLVENWRLIWKVKAFYWQRLTVLGKNHGVRMSGPIPTGNGCSLEDCYTNIFALVSFFETVAHFVCHFYLFALLYIFWHISWFKSKVYMLERWTKVSYWRKSVLFSLGALFVKFFPWTRCDLILCHMCLSTRNCVIAFMIMLF